MALGQFMPMLGGINKPPLVTEFVSQSTVNTNTTSLNLSSISVGTKEKLIMGFWCYNTAFNVLSLVSGSISGELIGNATGISLWAIDNPGGPTESFVAGLSTSTAGLTGIHCAVWGINQAGPIVAQAASSTASPGVVTIPVDDGGAIFALASPGNGAAGDMSWDGLDADYTSLVSSTRRVSGARREFQSAGDYEVSVGYSTSLAGRVLLAASVR